MALDPFTAGFDLVKTIFGGVTDHFEGKRKLKAARLETELAIELKRATADIDWDTQAMQNAQTSWKDEYLLIIFSPPLVMSFIPGLAPYVGEGFAVLSNTPDWYRGAIGIMVAASFGMRAYAQRMIGKK